MVVVVKAGNRIGRFKQQSVSTSTKAHVDAGETSLIGVLAFSNMDLDRPRRA